MGISAAAFAMDCEVGNLQQNTERVCELIRRVKQENHETMLAVFPEMCLYGYDKFDAIAISCPKQELPACLNQISAVCQTMQIDAVIGAPYFAEIGIENALYYLSMAGDITHVYSKTHLIEAEKNILESGDSYGICHTPLGKAGFLICWDTSFAEAARLYASAGAELLIVSAAWELPYDRQWELAVCGRAYDNAIPVIASNRTGMDGMGSFFGRAMMADCMGNIITETPENQAGCCFAEASVLLDKSARLPFGLQTEELRTETYQMKHMKFY